MEGISGADLALIAAVIAGTLLFVMALGGLILYVFARLVSRLVSNQVHLITENLAVVNRGNREAGTAPDEATVSTISPEKDKGAA